MFRGVTHIPLDAKSRFAIPTRYREELVDVCEGQVVVTANKDGCLVLYPLPEWEVIEARIMALKDTSRAVRDMKRFITGYVHEAKMDSQGRVSLNEGLCKFSGIGKNLVLVGQGKKFELWQQEAWEGVIEALAEREETEEEEASVALGEFGF